MREIIKDINELSGLSSDVEIKTTDDDKVVVIGNYSKAVCFTDSQLVNDIVNELKEIVLTQNLTALSAPQIGYYKRVFVINFDGDVKEYVNPIIEKAIGIQISKEQCVSLPGRKFIKIRHPEIVVTYLTRNGVVCREKLSGLAAITFQEQYDHLEGLLLSDAAVSLEIDDDFENASEDDQFEVINVFIDAMQLNLECINEDIEKDEELKEISDAISFMDKVRTGEVKLGTQTFEIVRENKEQELLN